MSSRDSEQYKEGQRQGWDTVASGWQKWWKITETGADKVSRRLIELADIKQGSTVLDIATGIGEPSITAANQVGNSGHVLAIDISSQMLSIAKQRAISLGLEQVIEFKEGDAETIDLSASTFDAALCRFGLMFLPDLRNSLIESGFNDVTIERMDVSFNFDSAEVYTSFVYETAAPVQAMLANQPHERREEILKAITESARKYAENDTGSVSLSNEAICVVGTR